MGGVADLLRQAREAGLRVEAEGGNLRIRGPREAETLVQSLRAHKGVILALLAGETTPGGDAAMETQLRSSAGDTGIPSPAAVISSPLGEGRGGPKASSGRTARQAWEAALAEMTNRWEAHAANARATGQEPIWLEDDDLQAAIRDAILRSAFTGTLDAIASWRRAWDDAMAGASELPPPLLAAAARLPAADLGEWRDAPETVRREAAHREFLTRADQMIAESEGRRPPPNPTVHEMFAGTPVSEERSLTTWLRRHAPGVAALWPQAPLGARPGSTGGAGWGLSTPRRSTGPITPRPTPDSQPPRVMETPRKEVNLHASET